VTFQPPDKRRRDRDNLQASLKAHFDGIADALGVNDSLFVPTYAIGEPVKGGAVRVEITPL
jgi:crossover junction endodeoxyribonuclease RusA